MDFKSFVPTKELCGMCNFFKISGCNRKVCTVLFVNLHTIFKELFTQVMKITAKEKDANDILQTFQ